MPKESENNVLVVGLGASAGGLKALKEFFSSLPENPDMAFIVILHLSLDHESKMAELLQLQITDDGKGFSATAGDGKGEGSGVDIMRHRMELNGGEFAIEEITHPGESGTRITCRLPVKYVKEAQE